MPAGAEQLVDDMLCSHSFLCEVRRGAPCIILNDLNVGILGCQAGASPYLGVAAQILAAVAAATLTGCLLLQLLDIVPAAGSAPWPLPACSAPSSCLRYSPPSRAAPWLLLRRACATAAWQPEYLTVLMFQSGRSACASATREYHILQMQVVAVRGVRVVHCPGLDT